MLAISVGTFDGVHRGHARVVARAREIAAGVGVGGGGKVLALVFDPHPMTVLRPEAAPARLSTFDQRRAWLIEAGADYVERLDPASGILNLSPEQFVDRVMASHAHLGRVAAWVEGPDFHFGKHRAGSNKTLEALGATRGFETHVIEHLGVAGSDHQIVPCRSSTVRWLLGHGRVFDTAALLGRWYEMRGTVETGDRRGRTIGFPTANLRTDLLAPAAGVYAARARLDDGRVFAAAVNIGPRPTFDRPATIEAHLIDADGAGGEWKPIEGLAEYGWGLSLSLVSFLRETMKFSSIAGLREQLQRDVVRARQTVEMLDPVGGSLPRNVADAGRVSTP